MLLTRLPKNQAVTTLSYLRLIPTLVEYADRFRQLDPLDFKIIKAMHKIGISNLSKLAKIVGAPQQTISYHVKRFDEQDLVRFRALIDEAKLGLKSYVVMGTTEIRKEDVSSRALTCFPLWRYLAIVDGWTRGSYVRYAIPQDRERDLKAFLNELKKRELVSGFEIFPTTSPTYPLLNLDFYLEKKGISIFDWDRWVKDLENFPEKNVIEPVSYEKARFDLYDLLILRCLELNARTTQREIVAQMAKILKEKEYDRFIPLVSRRLNENIIPQGLIRGNRVYLFPNPGPTVLYFMYNFVFQNNRSLRKFATALDKLPFNTGYEKILKRDELFVRFIMPTHEFSSMRKAVKDLAETGYLKDAHLILGNLMRETWDNVEIHQMYVDGTWNFSYGMAMEMLEKTLVHK